MTITKTEIENYNILNHFIIRSTKLLKSLLNFTSELALQNAPSQSNSAMDRLKRCVLDNWKDMRREFRSIDRNAIGVVNHNEFRQVLRQFNINMSEEEFFDTMKLYDKDMSGMISYNDFVRAFLRSA